jgi:acetolactate synthase I/II/III large subunit
MNGAESLIRTLVAGGVNTCFTNPGTSEMHIVAALDRVTEMRCVLGLFEGVATGAADGYARISGKPACTLLHLGPGLANGTANLHNASKGQVPIINLIGQHPAYHLEYDAPLTSDIEGIARPYSRWLRTSRRTSELGRDAADAIVGAGEDPGQIATLIVPTDVAWSDGGMEAPKPFVPKAPAPPRAAVDRAAEMLRTGTPTALLLTGRALYGDGLKAAGRIAAATSAKLLAPYPLTRMERGAGKVPVQRLPYVPDQAREALKEFRQLILVGTTVPVSYFGYPGKSSVLSSPDCVTHVLASLSEDRAGALEALATALSLNDRSEMLTQPADRPAAPSGGEVTLPGLATAVAALLPENAIVVDEAMTSGRGMMAASKGIGPHDWLGNTGGAIGIALPLAVGAAVAAPERRVLCMSADGSSMYTPQALWTMAREGLNVTTVIFANRAYAVLQWEYSGIGVGSPGPRAADLFTIGRPDIDWVMMAKSMGIPAARATSLDTFGELLRRSFAAEGPSLIEISM